MFLKEPEFQAKLQAVQTPEELLALIKEEGFEIPDEALESIAGGVDDEWGAGTETCVRCPKCKYDWNNIPKAPGKYTITCEECGHTFEYTMR